MIQVAVVILNHNGISFLQKFLPVVIRYSTEGEVVVADNGSTDGSIEFLQTTYPEVRLILLPRNEGFSKGYNLALGQIKATYYVLLNSDVEVTPQWLAPLLTLMDSNKQIAACQPKIKSYHQKHSFEYAGAGGGFIDKYGYPFCRGRIFTTLEEDTGQYDDNREIFWATGACMMVRADLYWQLGGLDNEFFAHMEEIDLCWRMKNAGYKVMYCGQSTVYHVGGGTLPVSNPKKTYLNFRNGIILLYKNLPSRILFKTIFVRLLLDGIAGIQFLLSGSFRNCWAIIKAHVHFYTNYSHWQQQRRQSIRLAKEFNHVQIYKRSIVYDYFIRRKQRFNELIF